MKTPNHSAAPSVTASATRTTSTTTSTVAPRPLPPLTSAGRAPAGGPSQPTAPDPSAAAEDPSADPSGDATVDDQTADDEPEGGHTADEQTAAPDPATGDPGYTDAGSEPQPSTNQPQTQVCVDITGSGIPVCSGPANGGNSNSGQTYLPGSDCSYQLSCVYSPDSQLSDPPPGLITGLDDG